MKVHTVLGKIINEATKCPPQALFIKKCINKHVRLWKSHLFIENHKRVTNKSAAGAFYKQKMYRKLNVEHKLKRICDGTHVSGDP